MQINNVLKEFVFEYRNRFGQDWYFPLNDSASLLCKMGKRKVFTIDQIIAMKDHGWQVVVK